jgi:NADH:ubiquinone oxidoreductase subunit E
MKQIEDVLFHFSKERSNLIPLLHELQSSLGYLSPEAMQAAAAHLGMSASEVYGVATFYAAYKLKPSGRHCVKACRGTACHVKGAGRVLGELEKELGIKPGETRADMEYSLETVACIGACALAPTITVDDNTYGDMTPRKVVEMFGNGAKQE